MSNQNKYYLFIPIFTLSSIFNCLSQTIQFSHLTIGEGLSQNTINCIKQDKKGFLWFGTEDGLNRYDGYEFKIYKHMPNDSNSLRNNSITCLLEDQSGNLWIGTNGGGLHWYNRDLDRVQTINYHSADQYSLSHDSVTALYEDRDGTIWIGTAHGLDRMTIHSTSGVARENKGPKTQFFHYSHEPSDPNSLSHEYITSLVEDSSGSLWIGTYYGLNQFEKSTEKFRRYQVQRNNHRNISSNYILCLYIDTHNTLWVGTELGGLNKCVRDREGTTFSHYKKEDNNSFSLSSNNVYSIYEDHTGSLWIGTDNGLNRFDQHENKFNHYQHSPHFPNSLSNNQIWSIFEGRSGVFWVGTDGGINICYSQKNKFNQYSNNPINSNSLSHNYVWSIDEDQFGNLWVATYGGLNCLDHQKKEWNHYRYNPSDPNSIATDYIFTVFIDQNDVLWVGLNGYGLNRLMLAPEVKKSPKFLKTLHNPEDETSLSGDYVTAIHEDRSGQIWIGTLNNGLNLLETDTKATRLKFKRYCHDPNDQKSISSNQISVIYEDHYYNLWIGTDGGGINCYQRDTEKFQRFQHDPGNQNSISNNSIMAIHEDKGGNLWIGSYGGGLSQYDYKISVFHNYTEEEGLANNMVYGILEDDHGHLWLSTNKGISQFNPQNGTFRNFSISDRVQNYEFNAGAYYQNQHGEMFFGGIHGINYFHPDSIRINSVVPPIVITDFQLFNKSVEIGETDRNHVILERSITETEEIILRHNQNHFSLTFAALNYLYPEKNKYCYILENFEKNWNHVGNRRFAPYANIPPGRYLFRVKGSNNDDRWNRKGVNIKITIVPPFWQTLWFRIGLFLIIIFGMIFIQEWRTRSFQRRNRELEQRVKERTEDLEDVNKNLKEALEEVQTLSGMLPICVNCKKIRDDKGYWQQVEVYIRDHSEAEFTHGLCPDCYKKYNDSLDEKERNK